MAIAESKKIKGFPGPRDNTERVVQLNRVTNSREGSPWRADIREYVHGDDNGGFEGFTRKGVTFRMEEVPELIAALQEAQKQAPKG